MASATSNPNGTTTQDEFLSVTSMLASRAAENPDLDIVGVPDADFTMRRYTLGQLEASSSRLARHYESTGLLPKRADGDTTTKSVIGLLAPSSFDYAVQELAILKLGHCALFLSVSIPPAAIAHLLKATGCRHVLVHPSLRDVGLEAGDTVTLETSEAVQIVDQAPETLYEGADLQNEAPYTMMLSPAELALLPSFIVHSSGSTGLPKPIFITHKASCYNFSNHFGFRAFTTLPLFHAHGHSCFFRAIYSKLILYLFPTELPLTTANVMGALRRTPEVDGFYGVPYILKLLAESETGLEILKSFKLVTYGGAACPDELGDRLVLEHDVKLVGHYGCTEMGQLMTSFRDFETDKAWNYVRSKSKSAKTVAQYLRFNSQPDGSLELIVKPGWPAKVMENLPDGSYTTKDLFRTHPSIPDAYKFVGRLDDTLVLYTGEKINPVPIELLVKGSSVHVAESIVFGAGKSISGILILPTELAKDIPPAKMFELVWPHVQAANAKAPNYAAISPEMILFLPFNTPIPKADKGSFIRAKVYVAFHDLIETTYAKFEAGELHPGGVAKPKQRVHGEALSALVVKTLVGVVGPEASTIGSEQDLFSYGVNSLQAARMRTIFQRDLELSGLKLPTNMVFENPTVGELTQYLEDAQAGKAADAAARDARQIDLMRVYLEKYSKFPGMPVTSVPNGVANGKTGRSVVVLTGASGSLGAHLLHQLLAAESTEKVYCLVRAKSSEQAVERINESLVARSLPTLTGSSSKKVICLPSSPADEKLGLDSATFSNIASTVTHVIHNAWAVNFNMGVESFEEHIKGAYNLICLAMGSGTGHPAHFYFSSSVSAAAASQGASIAEAVSTNPLDAQSMGYARSKWIVENICKAAHDEYGMRAEVLRIGQMVGDTQDGVWNDTEAISLMIKSAEVLGCAPDLAENLSWLPVDFAARAIIQLLALQDSSSEPCEARLWHVMNPKTTTWTEVYQGLHRAGMEFQVVPVYVWLETLRNSSPDVRQNPTYKLLDFFSNKYGGPVTSKKRAAYSTEATTSAAPALKQVPDVSTLVEKFAGAWQRSGFLKLSA